jgi:hypothetical protein
MKTTAMYVFTPYLSHHSWERLRMLIGYEDRLKIEQGPLSLVNITDLNTGKRYLIGFAAGTTPVILEEYA